MFVSELVKIGSLFVSVVLLFDYVGMLGVFMLLGYGSIKLVGVVDLLMVK